MSIRDSLSRYGAIILRQKIVDYWKARGFPGIHVEASEIPGNPDLWQIRSNMDAFGFPPRRAAT